MVTYFFFLNFNNFDTEKALFLNIFNYQETLNKKGYLHILGLV